MGGVEGISFWTQLLYVKVTMPITVSVNCRKRRIFHGSRILATLNQIRSYSIWQKRENNSLDEARYILHSHSVTIVMAYWLTPSVAK